MERFNDTANKVMAHHSNPTDDLKKVLDIVEKLSEHITLNKFTHQSETHKRNMDGMSSFTPDDDRASFLRYASPFRDDVKELYQILIRYKDIPR
jgi:hypothetical protein